MPSNAPGKTRTISSWVLRIILALVFLTVGYTKLTGTANSTEYFAAIGWGQWLRYLTGAIDIVGSALLFVPRLTCYGAAMLACSVGLATVISLTVLRGNPLWGGTQMFAVPLVFTVLAITLARLTWPDRLH